MAFLAVGLEDGQHVLIKTGWDCTQPHVRADAPAKLASQRSNVLIAAFRGAEMEGLASHFLLEWKWPRRCRFHRPDLSLTRRSAELGWTGRAAGPWVVEPGFIASAKPSEDDPDDALQHGNHDDRDEKVENCAKHCRSPSFYPKAPLFFLVGRLAGSVDAGLRVQGGGERGRDVRCPDRD